MRVLALVTEAYGGYGGIARYNGDLIDAISNLEAAPEIEVLPLYARDPTGPLPARVRQHAPRSVRTLYSLFAIGVAARRRPDVVFCGHLHLSPVAAWIARRNRCAFVCQAHGLEVWPQPSELRRRSFEMADALLCVSRDTRARVLTWADMPPERLRVVPNTVADEFRPGPSDQTRQRLGLVGHKVILSVSRLDGGQRHKGQDRIIAALPGLVAAGHDVVYLIVGEGDDAPRLAELARRAGVNDRIRFLGRVPQSELPDLYRATDLFALPSTGDGFGIVFLEAMACGLPAVGLAKGGVADALADGDLGVLASETNLVEALDRALTQNGASVARAQEVRRRFGREPFQARIAAVFASLGVPAPLRRFA
jgi:phosphatidylinositol alpha-1,6-mannosyltransferase